MRTGDAAVHEIMSGVQTGLTLAVQAALAPGQDGRNNEQWSDYWAKLAAEAQCALSAARRENIMLREELTDTRHRLAIAKQILAARRTR